MTNICIIISIHWNWQKYVQVHKNMPLFFNMIDGENQTDLGICLSMLFEYLRNRQAKNTLLTGNAMDAGTFLSA